MHLLGWIPYRRLHEVVANASGMTLQSFMNREITLKTGIGGVWIDKVLYSKPRSMARFGLLALSNGKWGNQTILKDVGYLANMTKPTQSINLAYGYLWWLNGQSSFMLLAVQFVFQGSIVPNAPADMYCALGKNDQKIYVVPSQNLVVIRMGQDGGEVTGALSSFDNLLWDKINQLACTSATHDTDKVPLLKITNPSHSLPSVEVLLGRYADPEIQVIHATSSVNFRGQSADYQLWQSNTKLQTGVYILKIKGLHQKAWDCYKIVIY